MAANNRRLIGALILTIVSPYQASVCAASIFSQSNIGGGVRRTSRRRMRSIVKSCSSFDTSSYHTCCPCFANRYNDNTNIKYRRRKINSLAFINPQQSRISTSPRIPYQQSTSTFININNNNNGHHRSHTQLQMSLIPNQLTNYKIYYQHHPN